MRSVDRNHITESVDDRKMSAEKNTYGGVKMVRGVKILFVLLLSLWCLSTVQAEASSIPGLFNTGVDNSGALLPDGSTDPHYSLIISADPSFPGPSTEVINSSGYPIPPWLSNGPSSKWIAPSANENIINPPGLYDYQITFNLTGLDPSSAVIVGEWATDNSGVIFINGTNTGITNASSSAFTSFTISSGFVAGLNTLDFKVTNGPTGGPQNPTGLNVTLSGTAAHTYVWREVPGAIISCPALAWNPVSNKMHMVVRGDWDTIWLATFNSDGSFNNDWTLIPGAIISAPALAWNPVSNKMHMVVRSSGDTIWSSTFNSDGSFNNDWTHIPGTIISPPSLVWNSSSNKMHMVVRGGGDTIWASTFNSDATFNSDWTQIPGAIISPPTLVWNSLSNEAQLVVQGSGNTVWTATFTSTGTFRNDWTLVPGAVMSSPALTWNPVINNIQLVVQGSGEAIWSSTFNSNGAFNGDWSQIPGAIIDQPAIAWNPVKGNLLIVVRGTNNSIWTMEY